MRIVLGLFFYRQSYLYIYRNRNMRSPFLFCRDNNFFSRLFFPPSVQKPTKTPIHLHHCYLKLQAFLTYPLHASLPPPFSYLNWPDYLEEPPKPPKPPTVSAHRPMLARHLHRTQHHTRKPYHPPKPILLPTVAPVFK